MGTVSDRPVTLTTGIPETVLDPEPEPLASALQSALAESDPDRRRAALAAVVVSEPRCLEAWAQLARVGRDPVERYAYARVGYHRGLDRLRGAGWRGSGYVRWRHPSNRGFLRALDELRAAADVIGERDEAARCAQFLLQLDPDWERRPDPS